VVCRIPFGFPVVPDVYGCKAGLPASIASGWTVGAALDINYDHQNREAVRNETVWPCVDKTDDVLNAGRVGERVIGVDPSADDRPRRVA